MINVITSGNDAGGLGSKDIHGRVSAGAYFIAPIERITTSPLKYGKSSASLPIMTELVPTMADDGS